MIKFYKVSHISFKMTEISLENAKNKKYYIDGRCVRLVINGKYIYAIDKNGDGIKFHGCNEKYVIKYDYTDVLTLEQMCEKYPEFKIFYIYNVDMFEC